MSCKAFIVGGAKHKSIALFCLLPIVLISCIAKIYLSSHRLLTPVALQKHVDWNPSSIKVDGEFATGFQNLDYCFPSPASILLLKFIKISYFFCGLTGLKKSLRCKRIKLIFYNLQWCKMVLAHLGLEWWLWLCLLSSSASYDYLCEIYKIQIVYC